MTDCKYKDMVCPYDENLRCNNCTVKYKHEVKLLHNLYYSSVASEQKCISCVKYLDRKHCEECEYEKFKYGLEILEKFPNSPSIVTADLKRMYCPNCVHMIDNECSLSPNCKFIEDDNFYLN